MASRHSRTAPTRGTDHDGARCTRADSGSPHICYMLTAIAQYGVYSGRWASLHIKSLQRRASMMGFPPGAQEDVGDVLAKMHVPINILGGDIAAPEFLEEPRRGAHRTPRIFVKAATAEHSLPETALIAVIHRRRTLRRRRNKRTLPGKVETDGTAWRRSTNLDATRWVIFKSSRKNSWWTVRSPSCLGNSTRRWSTSNNTSSLNVPQRSNRSSSPRACMMCKRRQAPQPTEQSCARSKRWRRPYRSFMASPTRQPHPDKAELGALDDKMKLDRVVEDLQGHLARITTIGEELVSIHQELRGIPELEDTQINCLDVWKTWPTPPRSGGGISTCKNGLSYDNLSINMMRSTTTISLPDVIL